MTYALNPRVETQKKKQTYVGSKSIKNIVGKTKIEKMRIQQIRESCGIQPINEWLESGRTREWDENVTKIDAERLFKISKDHIPAGR